MQTAEQKSFVQTTDSTWTGEVVASAWCPTMDLLAIATADGQLYLHRLNWQRVWLITPDSPVTAVCWHPSGKGLATGHKDGTVSLLHLENGDVLQQQKFSEAAIVSIGWVEDSEGAPPPGMVPTNRAASLFKTLSGSEDPAAGPKSGSAAFSQSYWAAKPGGVDCLCAADSKGSLFLCTFGLFLVASLDIRSSTPQNLPGSGSASTSGRQIVKVGLWQLTHRPEGQEFGSFCWLCLVDKLYFVDRGTNLFRYCWGLSLAQAYSSEDQVLERLMQSWPKVFTLYNMYNLPSYSRRQKMYLLRSNALTYMVLSLGDHIYNQIKPLF